jgi:hypothetical protein
VLSGRSATRPDTLPGELLDAGQGGRSPLLERGAEPLGYGRVQVVVGRQPPPRDLQEVNNAIWSAYRRSVRTAGCRPRRIGSVIGTPRPPLVDHQWDATATISLRSRGFLTLIG